ncbi:hypothetical protein BGZ58_003909 [Dissophora ornata]|nr:hypothetical protein BGZ58_003909 [Dissophora ornata]
MQNNFNGHPTWVLPGEATQANFDSELEFYPASSATEASWNEGAKGVGLVPASSSANPNILGAGSMPESLSFKAQLAQGPLASFLSAAGNTFHNRGIHDSSDLPQHTSIASLTLQEHKIILALKFDSPQYIVSQHPGGPPAVGEVMSILRRLVFNDDVRSRFPHQMGRTLLEHERSSVQRNVPLWTTEDIINLSPFSRNDESGHDCLGDLSEQELRERRTLGWTGGYDIFHEFRRLKFDTSLWYGSFCPLVPFLVAAFGQFLSVLTNGFV